MTGWWGMARSWSPEAAAESGAVVAGSLPALGGSEKRQLLELADGAIRHGLEGRRPAAPDLGQAPHGLRVHSGVFVTVTVAGELNGCIGSVWATEPLWSAVPRLAWEAAFADPRLPSLVPADYPQLDIKVAVLSEPALLDATSEDELLAALRPGVDGLIITAGRHRATFLPAVWEMLPDPSEFVAHLKLKAGIPGSWWPLDLRAHVYTATEFSSQGGGGRG